MDAALSTTAVSIAGVFSVQTPESGTQTLQKVLESRNGRRYQRPGYLALRPRNEAGFADEWVCRIAGLVKSVQAICNEDDKTSGFVSCGPES